MPDIGGLRFNLVDETHVLRLCVGFISIMGIMPRNALPRSISDNVSIRDNVPILFIVRVQSQLTRGRVRTITHPAKERENGLEFTAC